MQAIANFFVTVVPYLVAVFAFLFLIFIHEFGHFIAAKALGVRVNEFAIGFGPRLFHKQGRETDYSVRLLPIGGYCAMEGEDETSTDPKAFCNKKPWWRFIIVLMGAVFNLLTGVIIIGIVLAGQSYYGTTTVAVFSENASSEQTGLCVGDEILTVDGRRVYTTYDIGYNFSAVKDGKIDFTVLRDGKKVELKGVTFETEELQGYNVIKQDFKFLGQKKTLKSFLSQTFKTSISYGRMVVFSLVDMFGGRYRVSDVSGPVGVTATIGQAVSVDFSAALSIIALIAINLGIFNLLPLPALDGGRLFFIFIEMVFRRPVPQKYEKWVHAAGMALLLPLMVIIIFKDIFSLIF